MRLEGAYACLEYTIDGTEIATLRLYRTYLQHLEGQGFEILFAGFGDDLHDRRPYDFLFRSIIAATPSTSRDVGYICRVAPTRPR